MSQERLDLIAILTLLNEKGLISQDEANKIADFSNLVDHLVKTGTFSREEFGDAEEKYSHLISELRGYLSSQGAEKGRIKEKIETILKGNSEDKSANKEQKDFVIE